MRQAPLSSLQEGLWFFQQLEPDSGAYNNILLVRLEGKLDAGILKRSVNELIRRHEALRTCFSLADGVPAQYALADFELSLPSVSVPASAPEGERFAAALRRVTEEAGQPFTLAADRPPVRALLVRAGPDDHLFLLTIHHIVCDGESVTTLMRELVELYTAFAAGRTSPLAALPLLYIDAINKRQQQLTGERLKAGIDYWKEQLADAPPLLSLPLDRPRPAVQSFRGGLHRIVLPRALIDGVRAFSRTQGVTVYMTVLAAFQVLLYRFSGQEDVLVGTPMTGRTRGELRGMVGYLVNTIVLRSRLCRGLTVRELLRSVHGTAVGAFRHSHVPFERVVQALRPPRSRSYHPLFQAFLSFHERSGGGLHESNFAIPGLRVSFPQLDIGISRFDLSLCVHETAESLGIDFEYSSDLFDSATIERMARHFQVLLEGMLRDPDAPVDELPLLTRAEHELLTGAWSHTTRVEPGEQCLHQLIEAQAARTPGATAIVCGQERMTYAELDRRANQLAHRLRRLGVGPEQLVCICVERSPDMVIALLGVLKSGAGYVFVEPSTPRARCEFILRDSDASVVVARERVMTSLPLGARTCICLDRDKAMLDREESHKPAEAASGENLAYAIYTSGSTGMPKAVGIRHAGCASFLYWAATVFTPDDIAGVLASSSPMFDCALFELFMPLAWGGTAVLADSLLSLPELQSSWPVTLLMAAPTVIAELLQSSGLPASVQAINLSGEAVPRFLPEILYSSTAVGRVFNFFGISEITTHATGALLRPDGDDEPEGSRMADPVIGRPIANVSAYILDANMNPVPIGVTGELYIGGSGVARGYLGRPGLTAERFLPDPYSGVAGSRLYSSGDLARYRSNGDIEFLGRGDNQVKLRGFRVELGEVESALLRCPGVYAAAVLLREDQPGRKRLVGYVVPADEAKPAPAELRAYLRERLPEHEVPAAFTFLQSLPLLPNGKVNRAALPAAEPEIRETDDGVWRLADAIETQVELIWNELLDRHETVSWDSFFDLGGDSLLALVMLTRVQETFGVRIPVGNFMAAPTVEELSSAIRDHGWSTSPSCVINVSGSGGQRPFFCIHPGGGELYELRYLRRELGERPIYALMPIGWNGETEPLASIEEMATYYIERIREVQAAGPYHLGGYSLGGVIAFEIAQQLTAAGEQISFLGLFETWPVVDVVCVPEDAYEYESTAAAVELARQTGRVAMPAEELLYLKSMSYAIPGLESLERSMRDKKIYDFEGLCRELEDMRPKLQQALDELKARGLVINEMDIGEFYRMHEVAAKQIWALSAYRPSAYPGVATLFAGRDLEGTRVLERVWKEFVGELKVERTASEEHSIFFRDPLVARALQRCLEEADAVSPASGRGAVGTR